MWPEIACAFSVALTDLRRVTLPQSMPAEKTCPLCGQEFGSEVLFCPRDGGALRALNPQASLVGQVIADRYLISRELGHGGMGHVYMAEHLRMGRPCALKVLKPALTANAEAMRRFSREAANASRISHPHVVQVYDFGESGTGLTYLAMELVEGESLASLLRTQGHLPPRRATAIALQIAEALAAAHEFRIVHRDLKPENVMLARHRDGSDVVKVVDFGVSRVMEAEEQKVTSTGLVIGTPDYMSPEQFSGDGIDHRSDLYSLGIIIFRMLSGAILFDAATPLDALEARIRGRAKRLSAARPDVRWPEALQRVIDRATAMMPADRYDSATSLAHDLERVVLAWLPDAPSATAPWDVTLHTGLPAGATPRRVAAQAAADVTLVREPATTRGSATEPPAYSLSEPPADPHTMRPAPAPGSFWSKRLVLAAVLGAVAVGTGLVSRAWWPREDVVEPGNAQAQSDSAAQRANAAAPDPSDRAAGSAKEATGAPTGAAAKDDLARPGDLTRDAGDGSPPEEPASIRTRLAEVRLLTDSAASEDDAREALRILNAIAPQTRAGSVEAKYRRLEANVKLDSTANVCRLIRELAVEGAGTRFEAGVALFATMARTACP